MHFHATLAFEKTFLRQNYVVWQRKAIQIHVPKISKLKRIYLFQRLNDLQQMMEIFTFMSLGLLIKKYQKPIIFFSQKKFLIFPPKKWKVPKYAEILPKHSTVFLPQNLAFFLWSILENVVYDVNSKFTLCGFNDTVFASIWNFIFFGAKICQNP